MIRWLVLLVLIAGASAYVAWPPINVVETGRTPEYPDLDPRTYAVVSTGVYSAAAEAIASMPHWQLVESGSGEAGTAIHAVRTTRLLRFKDDVRIRLEPAGKGTIVHVRSASRVGRIDFGQNARNIEELFAALDARIAASSR